MKSIKQQYIDLKEGRLSQSNFMRNVRMTLPHLVTNVTSFNDTIKILKNKGILNESLVNEDLPGMASGMHGSKDYEKAMGIEDDSPYEPSIKEEIFNDLELAKDYAKQISEKEGIVQHVNDMGNGRFRVEDWYDSDSTVASFDSGRQLNEDNISPTSLKEGKVKACDVHPHELRMGIKVEMEHTDDPKKAEKIALDHLAENPFYYTALKLSGVDTQVTPKKNPKPTKKKDETVLVDKANQMKTPKGVEKIKASANKAKKETIKPAKGVKELTHNAKKAKGIKQVMDKTGGNVKKVSNIKEGMYDSGHSKNINKNEFDILKKDPTIKSWYQRKVIEIARESGTENYIITWDNKLSPDAAKEIEDYITNAIELDLGAGDDLSENHLHTKEDQIKYILSTGNYNASKEELQTKSDEEVKKIYDTVEKIEKDKQSSEKPEKFRTLQSRISELVQEVLEELSKKK